MKKLVLPVLIVALFLALLAVFNNSASAFFHDKSSSGEFDCQKFWESLSDDDGLTIGGPRQGSISNVSDWEFSSKKKTVGRASDDSCDMGGIRYDTDSEGEAKNGFEINVSYFQNQEEAKDQLSSLKTDESIKVEDQNVSGDIYSMRTVKLESVEGRSHFLSSGNFGRTAGKLGNCVITLTHTRYAMAYQANTRDIYENQVALMDEVMGMTQEGWQALSKAKDLQQFCGGKAQVRPQRDIFSFIPVLNLELIPQFVGIIGFDTITAPELLNRKPTISAKDEDTAWPPEYKNPGQDDIIVLKGQGQLISSESSQAANVGGNNQLPFVIYVDSIFAGATSDMVQLKYAWPADSGVVVNVSPQSEVKFLKPTQDEKTQELKRMVKLKKANKKEKFGIQTDFLDLMVIGTHFWVKNDPEKKQTLVGVYEGKVEVKTKDGQTTTVSPNGDKPGIIIATQKLSVTKLVLAGLVLAAVIGGAIFFLKRK